jgi:hypothetical protein
LAILFRPFGLLAQKILKIIYVNPKSCYRAFVPTYFARLVIGASRTVGSAKKFVRITSGFGGGEFPKIWVHIFH